MFEEDLSVFFAEFGVTVKVLRTGSSFEALLDAPVNDTHLGMLDFTGSAPFLTCKSEDVSELERAEVILMDGVQYRIKSSRKDIASGLSILQLVEN